MSDDTIKNIKAKIMAAQTMNARELKDEIIKLVIETMPDTIKREGALQNPAAIEAAIVLSTKAAQAFATQLMFLLITKPKHAHECTMKFPPLIEALKEEKIDPFVAAPKGETVKDTPDAPAPTQRPGVA
jgi:hypothetical protein